MKNLLQRFSKQNIRMVARMLILLAALGSFGSHAYSQTITAPDVSRCGEGSVTLHASVTGGAPGGVITWYDVPYYGTLLYTGADYPTGVLQENAYYYVDYVVDGIGMCPRKQVKVTISGNSMQAVIFYSSGTFCNSNSTLQTVTRTGTPGGTYSYTSSPAGNHMNDFNTEDGSFTPSECDIALYTITYHIDNPAPDCFESDAITEVTITSATVAPTISYALSPFCTTVSSGACTLTNGTTGGVFSATPSGLNFTSTSNGTIQPSASAGGTYTVTYFIPGTGGCSPQSASTSVVITTMPTASIVYSGSPFCKDVATTQQPELTGTAAYSGGTFGYTGPGTLTSFNTSTGAFTPGTSGAGSYTVTYTVPATGNCASVAVTAPVVINILPTASMTGDAAICEGATEPNVRFTGLTGTLPFTFTYKINNGVDQTATTVSGSYIDVPQPTTAAGTFVYTLVSIMDANLCSQAASGTVTITVTETPIATFLYPSSPYCKLGTATPTFTGGGTAGTFTSDPTGVVFGEGGTIDLASTPAGTYTITNTISTCGTTTATAGITINALPTATISGTLTACLSTTLTASTDASNPGYAWYKDNVLIEGQSAATLAVDASGSYKVKVTDGTTGCQFTSEASSVVINPLPDASITGTLNACVTTTLTAVTSTPSPVYAWYTGGVLIEDETSETLVVTTSGLYTVKITSLAGCEKTSEVSTVAIYPATVAGTVTGGQTVCTGANSTLLTLNGSSGDILRWESSVSPFETWTPIANTETTYTAAGLTETTRFRAVLQSGVCTPALESTFATVTVVADPSLAQPGNVSICKGGTTTLTTSASGGTGTYNYQWEYSANGTSGWASVANDTPSGLSYSGNTSVSLVITGAGAETAQANYYRCVLTTSTPTGAGCDALTSAVTLTVTEDPSWISYSLPTPTTLCLGGTVAFSVNVKDGLGGTITWIRSNNATPGEGTEVTVTTGDAPGLGTWYYRPHFAPTGSGCNLTDGTQTTVTVSADPSWTNYSLPTPTSACVGGPIAFSVEVANGLGGTITWIRSETSGGTGTTVITGDTPVAGTWYYRPHYTPNGTGCNLEDGTETAVTVYADPTISTQPTATTYICAGGTATLSVTAANGTGGYSYQWQIFGEDWSNVAPGWPVGATYSGAATSTLTINTTNGATGTNNYLYNCIVTALGHGCTPVTSNTATVNVQQQPQWLSISAPTPTTLCVGGTVAFSATVASGQGGTITWVRSATSGGAGTTVITGEAPPVGTWYYHPHYAPTGNGCNLADGTETTVTVYADPTIATQPSGSTICIGATATFSVTAANGTGTYGYQWQYNSDGDGTWVNITNGTFSGFTYAGTTTSSLSATFAIGSGYGNRSYRCVVSSVGSGCTDVTSNSATVLVLPIPTWNGYSFPTTTICLGGSVSFSASVDLTYSQGGTVSWIRSTTSGGSGTTVSSPDSPGVGTWYYRPVYTPAHSGCGIADGTETPVTVYPLITISTQPAATTTICQGGSATLSVVAAGGNGTYSYQWQYSNEGSWNNVANGLPTSATYSGATSANLTVSGITGNWAHALYKCIVSSSGSSCSSAVSASADVPVVANPTWSTINSPTPTSLCVGGTVAFSASISGGAGGTISWIRSNNATPLAGTEVTVTTGETPVAGTWYYRPHYAPTGNNCTLADGSVTTVTVVADPTIVVQPAMYTYVCIGGTASISVTAANGTGAYSYQWEYDNGGSGEGPFTPVSNGTPTGASYTIYSVGNTSTLEVTFGTGSAPTVHRNYMCVVSSAGAGCTSVETRHDYGEITPLLVPSWNTSSYSFPTTTICLGGTVSFSTSLNNANFYQSGTIDWIRSATSGGSGDIVSSTACNATASGTDSPPTSGTWYYRPVYTGGRTGCGIADGTETTVTVRALPAITGQPSSPSAVCSGTGTPSFTVTATGHGLTYQWQEWAGSSWNNISSCTGIYSGCTTATLTLTGPTYSMNGFKYRCVVSGTCTPSVDSDGNATLTVYPLPTITSGGTAAAVTTSASEQTTTVAYSATTNSPTSYSINWATLTDQTSTSFAFASGGGSVTGIIIPAGTAAGTYTGTMTIATANGCTATQAVSVNVNPGAPTATSPQNFCGGN